MKLKLIVAVWMCLFLFHNEGISQKYFSKTGKIHFLSTTPLEDIEAESKSASTVFDLESGKIQWAVLIKSFEFKKALMQEHFNENYMESTKYPKAKFSGTILNVESLNLSEDGVYDIEIQGQLTIHGVTQDVNTQATLSVEKGKIKGSSELTVAVADYNIEIPSVVKDNIAKEITIKIEAHYEVLN